MQPLSIVIPSLNSEKEILNCLSTLTPQLREGDEIIIIDGGSMDGTLEIAQKYGCTIYLYPGATLGKCRDFGVQVSRNELILNTDTDIVWPSDFIDRLKKDYEEPDVVGVSGGWRDGKGRPLGDLTCLVIEKATSYADCICSYRKDAYLKTLGHPDIMYGEQILLWLQIREQGRTVYDADLLVYHFSEPNVRTPSYIIGGSVMASGAMYEASKKGSLGYGLIGHGAGWILGQVGVDLGINRDAPPDHFHHFHLGLLIAAAGLVLYGADVSEDVVAGVVGFGSGLVAHDVATEPTRTLGEKLPAYHGVLVPSASNAKVALSPLPRLR